MKTETHECAICSASGIVTYGATHEIERDSARDGLGHGPVYCCDECYAQIT